MTQRRSLITTDIDFDAEGLHRGNLKIPYSHNRSAYGYIPVPIWCSKGGDGPTVLLTGANHGDEFECPIALMRLLHSGAFDRVKGRVIVIPGLNFPAYKSGTRVSPIDMINLNRVFPGKRDGTVTEMLAHYLETELLPQVDVVLDMHAGGTSLNYLPTLITFITETPEERATLDLLVRGFNPPRELVMDLAVEDRMIGAAARRNNAIFVSGEFGGGATVTPAGVELLVNGLKGALAALGVIPGPPIPSDRKVVRMDVNPHKHYLYAHRSGLFEPMFVLGQTVSAGDLAGRLYDQQEPWRTPEELFFKGSGFVACVRTLALVEPGDCLAHLGEIVEN